MPAPPCGNYGDVNGDGDVTITDAMYVSQYLIGSRTLTADQLIRANVKGYGSVSTLDETLIADYVAGTITTFPVCGVTPPPSECPWDLNGDGIVDDADKQWLTDHSGPCTPGSKGDFNGDGVIDIDDLIIIGQHYGPCPGVTPPQPNMETRTVALTEGQHQIQVSLSGYNTLQATINVSSTGVTCVSVIGGACGGSSLPRVSTSGWAVTTYLKEGAAATNRCGWITSKDTSKVVFISEMVLAYNNLANIGFTPTAAEIGNAVLMYSNLGTPASLWGC